MINLIEDGTISGKIAKEVFEGMYRTGKTPAPLSRKGGWCRSQTKMPLERRFRMR